MKDRIEFYNSMSVYERFLFRKVCRLERKRNKTIDNLEKRSEDIDILLADVEKTNN